MEARVVLIRHSDSPFNVFEAERHPFLVDEHRWAEGCMNRRIPLLGICQGPHAPAEQDRLGAIHDARQHDWFMGFLERFLGQRLPAAALSA